MAKFTASQHAYIAKRARHKEVGPDEGGGELNIIPFLDIIMNVLMFLLATIATVFTATIPVPAPSSNPRPNSGQQQERLNITVKVMPSGYIVGAGGGFLLPGCTTIGAASITVANRGSADAEGYTHDFAALTQCMQAIRRQWATEVANDHSINVATNSDVPYGVLVRTIDAVREARPNACRLNDDLRSGDFSNADCLFPEATLGVLR
ncbi:MAG: biopolymer transporter ExbD [Polyangiales bacterium]